MGIFLISQKLLICIHCHTQFADIAKHFGKEEFLFLGNHFNKEKIIKSYQYEF